MLVKDKWGQMQESVWKPIILICLNGLFGIILSLWYRDYSVCECIDPNVSEVVR